MLHEHFEEHYSVTQIAILWFLSEDTIRRLFRRESGVIIIAQRKRGCRAYETLRIPHSVAARVYRRLQIGDVYRFESRSLSKAPRRSDSNGPEHSS